MGTIVYTLEGYDPEGGNVSFGLIGSDNFMVNPGTGEVHVVRALDKEVKLLTSSTASQIIISGFLLQREDTLHFLVSIKDKINSTWDSDNDNVVQVPISVIVLDENDTPPEFQNVSHCQFIHLLPNIPNRLSPIYLPSKVPYEVDVFEDAPVGTTVFDQILVTDKDSVGDNLDVICVPQPPNPDACDM